MSQPLEVILEKDGRLRALNSDDLKERNINQPFTIRIVAVDEASELVGYSLLSQSFLTEQWEDEPDIEEVWGDL